MENPHPIGCFWFAAAEQWGAPNVKWCEETLCSIISEPSNTWSNLAYFISAMFLFRSSLDRKKLSSVRGRLKFYAFAVFLCGAGSFVYHASNNRLTQFLDFAGMFAVAWPLQASNLSRTGAISRTQEIPLAVMGSFFWSILIPIFNSVGIPIQLLVMSLILGIGVTELQLSRGQKMRPILPRSRSYFYKSLACLGIAAIFSFLDASRIWCNPKWHVVQGHAIWHIFSAMALFNAGKYHAFQLERTEA